MLQKIAEGIWGDEHDVFMPGKIHFRARMVVMGLEGGGLLLHSPIPLDGGLAEEIESLGEVRAIAAPNLYHHLYFQAACDRFPEARRYGVEGFEKKRPDLSFDGMLVDGMEDFGGWEVLQIRGVPKINERVFYHGATKSLVMTDLLFHITEVANLRTRWLLGMMGAFGRLSQSRMWRFLAEDRGLAGECVERMLGWDIERVIMAHGAVIEGDCEAKLRGALGWMLGA